MKNMVTYHELIHKVLELYLAEVHNGEEYKRHLKDVLPLHQKSVK